MMFDDPFTGAFRPGGSHAGFASQRARTPLVGVLDHSAFELQACMTSPPLGRSFVGRGSWWPAAAVARENALAIGPPGSDQAHRTQQPVAAPGRAERGETVAEVACLLGKIRIKGSEQEYAPPEPDG